MLIFNNKKLLLPIIFCLLFFVYSGSAFAQEDINQKILNLREQIEELERKSEEYKGTIEETQKQAKTLQGQINILNNQIKRLQTNIIITDRQIDKTKLEIGGLSDNIFDTNERIITQQETMGEIISVINQRDSDNLLAIILKNNRFSDFFNQIRYTQNLQKQLTVTLVDLKNTKQNLQNKKDELGGKKQELEELNISNKNQKKSLDGSKYDKDTLLRKTQGKEVRFQELLNEVEQRKAEFFSELQRLESRAVETGAYILRVKSKIPPKQKVFGWPEDGFILTQGYGMTRFAKRGTYGGAPHNGIDMTSGFGTPIRAIGPGKILVSGTNNGWGNWASILHDNGLVSLYSHMNASIGLANNTPIKRGDIIGFEGATGNSTGSHLHLSLYYEFFTFINPRNNQVYFNYFDGTLNPLDYLE